MVPDAIEREILIEAPVAKVWAAITTAEHIGAWFGNAGATVDLRPGGALTCTWRDDENGTADTVNAVVEKVDEPHLFSYRWARPPGAPVRADNSTLVEFTLRPEGAVTRLKVMESGYHALAEPDEEKAAHLADNTEGWRLELGELVDYLRTMP
jgi:uncharacterized protein YndB with AHSA1/START domain